MHDDVANENMHACTYGHDDVANVTNERTCSYAYGTKTYYTPPQQKYTEDISCEVA